MNVATDAPSRPALRYHGGKFKMSSWIIDHFPEHVCYCEPFGGGASVLLRKPPAVLEVYNDINSLVVNFFCVLRERPAELIAAIDLTPYSREEFRLSQQPCDDPLELARRFYVWSWQGRGRAGVQEPGGWRFMSRGSRIPTPVGDWNNYDHLWAVARRMKQVQIEHDDALKVIRRFDGAGTLFYVDPPYLQGTRGDRWDNSAYKFEYTDDQHKELATALLSINGMIVLSGYPNNLYDELLDGWHTVERRQAKDNGAKAATEVLWLSPRTWQALQCRYLKEQTMGKKPDKTRKNYQPPPPLQLARHACGCLVRYGSDPLCSKCGAICCPKHGCRECK